MGFYVQTECDKGKAAELVAKHGGEMLERPPSSWLAIPKGKALICVSDHVIYDAAALVYSEREFDYWTKEDPSRKTWLLMDGLLAEGMSGYKRNERKES